MLLPSFKQNFCFSQFLTKNKRHSFIKAKKGVARVKDLEKKRIVNKKLEKGHFFQSICDCEKDNPNFVTQGENAQKLCKGVFLNWRKKWAKCAFYKIFERDCIFYCPFFTRQFFHKIFARKNPSEKFSQKIHFFQNLPFFATLPNFLIANLPAQSFVKGQICQNFLIAILPTQNFVKGRILHKFFDCDFAHKKFSKKIHFFQNLPFFVALPNFLTAISPAQSFVKGQICQNFLIAILPAQNFVRGRILHKFCSCGIYLINLMILLRICSSF